MKLRLLPAALAGALIPLACAFANDDAYVDIAPDKAYLWIPVANPDKDIPRENFEILNIVADGQTVQTLRANFPESDADTAWWASYPIGKLKGKAVSVACENLPVSKLETFRKIRGADAPAVAPDDYREPYRNQFHFSQRRGWNNDVNGLYYRDGVWHLFYQHNPLGVYWQNMSWGHAVSKDLIHWEEKGVAIEQNGIRDMAFSGTAFVDVGNKTGRDPSGRGADFIAYTSTGRGECILQSTDGGESWSEIEGNPVVRHSGRDPMVFWHAPSKKWVMVVYDNQKHGFADVPLSLPFRRDSLRARDGFEGHNFAFYTSENLKDWTLESHFVMPDRSTVYECPTLLEMPLDGNPKNTKWVIWGVMQYYHVGDFDGKKFTPLYPYSLTGVDDRCRAAIVFDNAPDGRKVLIGWAGQGWPKMVERWPDLRFSQGFTVPMELSLRTTPDGIRLFAYPVRELEVLREKPIVSLKRPTLEQARAALAALNGDNTRALDIVITYRQGKNGKLTLTENNVGGDTQGGFHTDKDKQPFTPAAEGELRMLVDTTLVETFLDNGRRVSARNKPVDKIGTTNLNLKAEGDVSITSLTVYPMKSIWEK